MPKAVKASKAAKTASKKAAAATTSKAAKKAATAKATKAPAKTAKKATVAKVATKAAKTPVKATKTVKAPAQAAKTPAKNPAKTPAKGSAKATPAKAIAKAAPKKAAPAPAKAAPAAKKAPAPPVKKAPAPPVKKAPGKVVLDKFVLEQRELLYEERRNHTEQADALRAEADALAQEMEPGDAEFGEEGGEGGTLSIDRERDLMLSAQARMAVEEIDAALAKIPVGTYGLCENCGRHIAKPRLKAIPYARLCMECKQGGLSRR